MESNKTEDETFKVLDQVVEHSQAFWVSAVHNRRKKGGKKKN